MRGRLGAAGMAVAAAGGLLLAAAPAAARTQDRAPAAAGSGVDRPVRDQRVSEASGLAVSPQHPGVLWTHDDSGHPPLLFALGPDGRVVGTVRLHDVADFDWEAVAAFRDTTGRALLAVGDLGDNRGTRHAPEIDVVAEPARLGTTEATPLLRLRLTYPDGPADAEALLVDTARRRMFVVTKGLFGGSVYVVPAAGWDGAAPARPAVRSARLVRVGSVPLGLVTDGTVAPGGAVLLRTYTLVAAFAPFPVDAGEARLEPVGSAALPLQRQGEGLALTPDGRSVLLSSEGAAEPVLRVDLTASLRAALSASGAAPGGTDSGTDGGTTRGAAPPASGSRSPQSQTAPGTASSGTPTTPAAPSPGASDGGGSLPWGALAVAAAVVAAIAVASARSRR